MIIQMKAADQYLLGCGAVAYARRCGLTFESGDEILPSGAVCYIK